jgi:hypothetical protein
MRSAIGLTLLCVGPALVSAGCGSSGNDKRPPRTVNGAALHTTGASAKPMGGMPKAVPIVAIGTSTWDGMKIKAQMSGPSTFTVPTGSRQRLVKPKPGDTGHLMVMLTDAQSGVPIPYSSVWATIREQGKIVFDERQWPMVSRFMGPHYGNNVSLPRAGDYTLTLLISPPQAARHLEYRDRWAKPHRVTMSFRWRPSS